MEDRHPHEGQAVHADGVVTLPCRDSVEDATARLEKLLHEREVKLFVLVDHSGEAEKIGQHMPPTKLLIFGSPRAGTPVMLASPTAAIDLPLKILIWEDKQQKVWVSYNAPAWLARRHALPEELLANIAAVEILAKLTAE